MLWNERNMPTDMWFDTVYVVLEARVISLLV